ncbi:hypothetical protein ZIOFF_031068 [Zingiber officinale]|uniref:Uncharacterized protein n=1 Tax=Zingiber officinale TaxID=94328 RepID=A0A8J5H5W8_ZINOF|nr:hypothetical protein ZIOFF_031068 [Zingiber officinale]
MILRTPVLKKRRPESVVEDLHSPVSDRRLVRYEEPGPITAVEPSDEMVCTYHCRQMDGKQCRLSKEVDSRKKAELSFTSAKERATDLEGRLQRLSDSAEREKNILKEKRQHLQDDSSTCRVSSGSDFKLGIQPI